MNKMEILKLKLKKQIKNYKKKIKKILGMKE